jgi:hypothetical protein
MSKFSDKTRSESAPRMPSFLAQTAAGQKRESKFRQKNLKQFRLRPIFYFVWHFIFSDISSARKINPKLFYAVSVHSRVTGLSYFLPIGWLSTLGRFWRLQRKPLFLGDFFRGWNHPFVWEKMDWATHWAIISQTHLVTLVDRGKIH